MKRIGWAVTLAALAGCSDPALNAKLEYSASGLTVRPAASVGLGGLRVSVTP